MAITRQKVVKYLMFVISHDSWNIMKKKVDDKAFVEFPIRRHVNWNIFMAEAKRESKLHN